MTTIKTRSLFDLTGKTALVTGGNSGVGLGYALGMARQGANIIVWGRSEEKNRAAEAKLREAGSPNVYSHCVDVSVEREVQEAFAEAVRLSNGCIDCVVSNAGYGRSFPSIPDIPTSEWQRMLEVHLNGGFYVVRAAAGHMKARAEAGNPGGSILICGSLSVFGGGAGMMAYSAAKSGLLGVMRSAAAELAQHGVRVNMVAPGYIKTGIVDDPAIDAFSAQRAPMKRVGTPGDLEAIAAYLACDGASFHTGDVITIDGGWMASPF